MLLENKFYKVLSVDNTSESSATYHLALLADCDLYRGHFPGKPVSPGVCNIETIKECSQMLTGCSLYLSTIKQCRLTAVASPQVCPEVDVNVSVTPSETGYVVQARISSGETVYMEFKGEMKKND